MLSKIHSTDCFFGDFAYWDYLTFIIIIVSMCNAINNKLLLSKCNNHIYFRLEAYE